jgi:hypothetical protein
MQSKESNMPVHGSVIQRSLIPEGLGAVLNIATVPISELDSSCLSKNYKLGFQRLVGQVLGVPTESILNDKQYRKLAEMFIDGDICEEMAMRAHLPYAEELCYWYSDWRHFMKESLYEMQEVSFKERPAGVLGLHSLSMLVSPTKHTAMQWPFFMLPPPHRGSRRFDEIGLTEEVFQLGSNCFFTAVSADERVVQFTHAAGRYDIPSGQSPSAKSDSLTKLIESSKKVCLAPLAVGGTTAISQLSQGSYVTALLSTSTGAAMTLILVGTVSVADYLVHYLLHKRNSIDNNEHPKQI